MMKRQVSPKAVAITILVLLGAIQLLYWRTLVYQAPGGMGQMKGGGMMGKAVPMHVGLKSVLVETYAGSSSPGYRDARGRRAQFDGPAAIASGPDGALYVADSRNHRIRKIAPDGAVTTVAGSGSTGTLDADFTDGPARSSRFRLPAGIVAAPNGDLYVADTGNHRIRLIRRGQVYTLAGGGAEARDEDGFPAGGFADGPGGSARFNSPAALALDASGNLYVADVGNQAIRKITPGGVVSTLARGSPLVAPSGVCVRSDGTLLVSDPAQNALLTVAGGSAQPVGDGQVLWENFYNEEEGAGQFRLRQPAALTQTADGLVYIADTGWHTLFFLTPDRKAFLVAGTVIRDIPTSGYSDGTGEKALFIDPVSLAPGPPGTLYVADFGNNCIRKVTADLIPSRLLSPPPLFFRSRGPQWLQEQKGRSGPGGFADRKEQQP